MTKEPTEKKIELWPDGWERFEKAVDAAVRTPAQHRPASAAKPKDGRASKGRIPKKKS
jgi:hypothetical protein